jgi:hypothetical protein
VGFITRGWLDKQRGEDLMQLPAQQAQTMRVLGSASVLAIALCTSPSLALAQESLPQLPQKLEVVRTSLAKYMDLAQSETDFYMAMGCIYYGDIEGGIPHKFDPTKPGQMTQINYTNLIDDTLNPEKPEGLIYEQTANGDYRLSAAVYMLQAGPDTKRPKLFGQEFEGPVVADKSTPLQRINLTVYDLHVWFWRENPDGLFTRTNPDLPCRFDSYEIRAQPPPFPVNDPRISP